MKLVRHLRYLMRGWWPRAQRQTCKDCWRSFGQCMDFLVSSPIWNYVMAGQIETVIPVRLGMDGQIRARGEGVGGVVCLECFDKRAKAAGVEYRDHLIVFGRDCWMGGSYTGPMPA